MPRLNCTQLHDCHTSSPEANQKHNASYSSTSPQCYGFLVTNQLSVNTMSSISSQYLSRRPLVLGLSKVFFLALCQIPVIQAVPVHLSHYVHAFAGEPDPKPVNDPSLWVNLAVAGVLVLLGGAFAGLTIALMGQDEIYLQVIQDSGEGAEKKNAGKVLRLLQRGKHWVLVTLILSNVITNETLPIVLDRSLGGGWPAVLGSTVLIGKFEHCFYCTLLTLGSHLRRNCPPVNMRAVRSPYRSVDGSFRFGLDVYHESCGMAYRQASRLFVGGGPRNNLQEGGSQNVGVIAQKNKAL